MIKFSIFLDDCFEIARYAEGNKYLFVHESTYIRVYLRYLFLRELIESLQIINASTVE